MTQKLTKFLVCVFMIVANLTSANAAYGDMNPGTCAPSGIINKTKEKIDPRGFWVKMFIDSQQGIESLTGRYTDEQWGGPEAHCMINNRPGSTGYTKCMLEMRNTLAYWVRCNEHARTMCRLHGGYC